LSKVAILGLGNILLKDEGFGVHVLKELEQQNLPENVELIDGGTASLDVLSALKDITKLIIVDSVTYGKEPGTTYCFRPDDLRAKAHSSTLSLHQMSVLESLSAVKKMGNLPEEIIVVGAEPKVIDWGLDLTPELKQKIPEVLNIIAKELDLSEQAGAKDDSHRKQTSR